VHLDEAWQGFTQRMQHTRLEALDGFAGQCSLHQREVLVAVRVGALVRRDRRREAECDCTACRYQVKRSTNYAHIEHRTGCILPTVVWWERLCARHGQRHQRHPRQVDRSKRRRVQHYRIRCHESAGIVTVMPLLPPIPGGDRDTHRRALLQDCLPQLDTRAFRDNV
jgi:hypothetical protein